MIVIYRFRSEKLFKREVIGTEKNPIEEVI
jgi:CRISPR/Cas system-associated endoribonuclease Cas2